MKIAIFENQYNQVKIQFDVANHIFFNDRLQYEQFNSSQDFVNLSDIVNYRLVIVDISLSSNSDKDGFDLIAEILKVVNHPPILILTANGTVKDSLARRNLPDIPVLMKPVDPIDIKKKISDILKI